MINFHQNEINIHHKASVSIEGVPIVCEQVSLSSNLRFSLHRRGVGTKIRRALEICLECARFIERKVGERIEVLDSTR